MQWWRCESNEAMWLTWVATYIHKIGLEERLQRNLLCTKNKRILAKCKVHKKNIFCKTLYGINHGKRKLGKEIKERAVDNIVTYL